MKVKIRNLRYVSENILISVTGCGNFFEKHYILIKLPVILIQFFTIYNSDLTFSVIALAVIPNF